MSTTDRGAQTDDLLAGRYALGDKLGDGAQGATYRALDRQRDCHVAVKELDFRKVDDWKALELFERESETLQSLEHPQIPAYVDAFDIEQREGPTRFLLVQELVDGEPLQTRLDEGRTMSQEEVTDLIDQLLDILSYLHAKSPPVVHRDIKPSNIIARPDGSYALIDFGAVQTIVQDTVGGSTVVGTAGYSPPEQMMGRAVPSSDLYALGATAVALLSGESPSDLPVERMKIQFRRAIDVDDELGAFLDRLLAPDASDRLEDAEAAQWARRSGTLPEGPADEPDDEEGLLVEEPRQALRAALAAADRRYDDEPTSELDGRPDALSIAIPAPPHQTINFVAPLVTLGIIGGFILLGFPTAFVFVFPVIVYFVGKLALPFWRRERQELELTADRLLLRRCRPEESGGEPFEKTIFETDALYLPELRLPLENSGLDESYVGRGDILLADQTGKSASFAAKLFNKNKLISTELCPPEAAAEGAWLAKKLNAYLRYFRGDHDGNREAAESTDGLMPPKSHLQV